MKGDETDGALARMYMGKLVKPFVSTWDVLNVLAYMRHPTMKITNKMHYKSKAIPLQAWTGLEGSRRLRLPDFKTIGT